MAKVNLDEVKGLIDQVDKTRSYERQQIIDYYNQIFDEDNDPLKDDSCLRMKMMQIKAWYQDELSRR